MISTFRSVLVLGFLCLAATQAAHASPYIGKPKESNTRVTYPSMLSVELLGRGMLGSVYFDQALNEDLAAGFGFSVVPTNLQNSSISAGTTAVLFPAYVNYYFMRAPGSIFITGGANLVANASTVAGKQSSVGSLVFSASNSSVIPTFGAGYESRGDTGFLFRVTAYGLVGDKLTGWVGFSFGYGF